MQKMKFKPIMSTTIDDEITLAAKHELWRMGDLSWKLKGIQHKLHASNINQDSELTVNLCSRRIGKTTTNLVTALEVLIQHDFSIIKYACPTQKMVKDSIIPILRLLMEDAPPEFQFDKCWSSENRLTIGNSFLSVAGTDNKNVENLRGAYAHLIFADEAGFWDDLSYAIDQVLLPQLDTTGGKLIMTSTPNFFNPRHEFHTKYVFPQDAIGRLQKFTVYDSSFVTKEEIENVIIPRYAHSGGINSPQFRCEYLVEIPRSSETTIIPNFYSNRSNIIVDEMVLPPFVDTYVSGDIGVRDLTVYLFGYYDYKTATLHIMDEWVMNGMEMTTKVIAEAIRLKEETHFTDSEGFVREPLRRVMDNNLNLIIDLNKLHGLNFIATKKDNKAAAINNLNILVDEGRLKIHSRCKNLIYHCENAQWKQGAGMGKEFDHLSGSIDGSLLESHADAVDALNYLVRNLSLHHNPYPAHINNVTENQQQRITHKEEDTSTSFIKKLLGRKR